MLSTPRFKIAGSALLAAFIFAGHFVLPAHAQGLADSPTLVANGTVSDALDLAAGVQTWDDPNTTCDITVYGQAVNSQVDVQRAAVSAEEAGEAVVTCFSFTHPSYTLTATLTLQDYDATTDTWSNLPGCSDVRVAIESEGLATAPLLVECFDPINSGATALHLHRAYVTFTATTGSNGYAPSFPPYLINY